MKYLVTYTHIAEAFEQLDAEGRKGLQKWHAEFVEILAKEKNTAMVDLRPPEETKVVRRTSPSGDLEVTDGALLAGKEFVGGYFVIEADSMDEAVEFCKRGRYMMGRNEIREIRENISV